MSPHTPEPWTLIEDHGPLVMGGGHFIGDRYVGGHCIARLIDSTEATPANARLMIAAPELLAAAEFLVEHHMKVCDETCSLMGIDAMRDAIRKARGR